MKRFRLLVILGLVLGIALYSLPAFAAPAAAADIAGDGSYVARTLIVKFHPGTDAATRQQVHGRHGGIVTGEIPQLGVEIVSVAAGRVPDQARAYRSEGSVAYAEPDYIARAFETGPDPYLDQQWGMGIIEAPAAWGFSTGLNVKVAILDSGVDQDHEDLAGKIGTNDSKNFSDSSDDDDHLGHGTHVAGIAAAVTNNALGVAGVGNACRIMNGKVLNDSGSGAYTWIANGIIWAADNGAKVINMSLGGKFASNTLLDAISYAWSKGVVIVASAGNSGNNRPNYPAYYTPCIAVAATNPDDSKASYSTYGDWVDVAAPGSNIFSTMPNHGSTYGTNYGTLSGTSMASPHVAGLAALVWATGGSLTNTEVRARIEQTAAETGTIWSTYGIPRISAVQAVDPDYVVVEPLTLSNLNVSKTTSTATISWTTNKPADSRVEFGTTTDYTASGSPVVDASLVTQHAITLDGLANFTTYYYRVTSSDGTETVSVTGSFKTKRK